MLIRKVGAASGSEGGRMSEPQVKRIRLDEVVAPAAEEVSPSQQDRSVLSRAASAPWSATLARECPVRSVRVVVRLTSPCGELASSGSAVDKIVFFYFIEIRKDIERTPAFWKAMAY